MVISLPLEKTEKHNIKRAQHVSNVMQRPAKLQKKATPSGVVPPEVWYYRHNYERIIKESNAHINKTDTRKICQDEWFRLNAAEREQYENLTTQDRKRYENERERKATPSGVVPPFIWHFRLNYERIIKESNAHINLTDARKFCQGEWIRLNGAEREQYEHLTAQDQKRYEKEREIPLSLERKEKSIIKRAQHVSNVMQRRAKLQKTATSSGVVPPFIWHYRLNYERIIKESNAHINLTDARKICKDEFKKLGAAKREQYEHLTAEDEKRYETERTALQEVFKAQVQIVRHCHSTMSKIKSSTKGKGNQKFRISYL
jgi:hypothetical protein